MLQNRSLLPKIEVLSPQGDKTSICCIKLLQSVWNFYPCSNDEKCTPLPLHAQMSHTIFASSGTGIDDKYSVHPYKCVECKSHLVCLALWKSICSPIVEWRTTIAQNVVSHLVNQENWRATWSPTLGRKYTNVQNAVIHIVWLNT